MCHMSCCCRHVWTSVAFWTCLFFFFLILSLFLSLLHGRSELNDRFSFYFVNSLKEEESAPQMPLSKAHPLRDIHAFRCRKLTFSVLSDTETSSRLFLSSPLPPVSFYPCTFFLLFSVSVTRSRPRARTFPRDECLFRFDRSGSRRDPVPVARISSIECNIRFESMRKLVR